MGKNTENIDKTLANNSSSNPAIPEPEVGSNILSAPQYSLDPNFTDTIDPLNLTNQSSDSMATIQPPEFNLNDKSSENDSNESIENKSTISSNNIIETIEAVNFSLI